MFSPWNDQNQMGANLCCARPSSSPMPKPKPKPMPKDVSSTVVHKHVSPIPASPNVSFIEKSYSIYQRKEEEEEKKKMKMVVENSSGTLTLGECLLNSPGMMSPQCITVKKLPPKIYLSSPELPVQFFTPGDHGFSNGTLEKVDEDDDEDDEEFVVNSSSKSRSRSGKLKKRVRFKEDDIIIFYSPGEAFEE